MQFQVDVTSSFTGDPIALQSADDAQQSHHLLRQLLEVQREQLALQQQAAAAKDMVGRWRSFLERWQDESVDGRAIEHPVVAVHPETGRKGLYVNPQFTRSIKGLHPLESRTLLDLLFDTAIRPENVIIYRWRQGDVGFWDNRAIWHRRVADFDLTENRVVHRVQLRGTRPVGPASVGASQ